MVMPGALVEQAALVEFMVAAAVAAAHQSMVSTLARAVLAAQESWWLLLDDNYCLNTHRYRTIIFASF
jgi:hypothetical protein